jgi:hypothetical protein
MTMTYAVTVTLFAGRPVNLAFAEITAPSLRRLREAADRRRDERDGTTWDRRRPRLADRADGGHSVLSRQNLTR